ncbi:lipoprotein N-acyltransferase Lnb domain-containing protein [Marinomonas sp.]
MKQGYHPIKFIFILIALLSPYKALSHTPFFDISLSEFLLKNSSAIISQIHSESGLAYESLKYQLIRLGCSSEQLTSQKIKDINTPFELRKNLTELFANCDKRENPPKNIFESLKNKDVYLVLAGESLKSPMSYFGHSMILFLDQNDFYFSPVLSVLAKTDELTPFEEIIKGGFSEIEAQVNFIPFHQIIDYYNNQESRELRLIKLPPDEFDKEKLIQHFEKLSNRDIKYNFFTQNCSTYIYEALESSCNCLDHGPHIITPISIEKKIYEISYNHNKFELNSLFSRFHEHYNELSNKEKSIVKGYYEGDIPPKKYNHDVEQSAILASRLSFNTYGKPNSTYSNILNTFGYDSFLLQSPPSHSKPVDSSLDSTNISSAKLTLFEAGVSLKLSAVDFNHHEQRQQRNISSKLSVASIEIYQQSGETKIHSIDALDIRAINPIDFVSQKASWRLKVGAEENPQQELKGLISFAIGAATQINKAKLYILPSVEISESSSFPVYAGIQYKTSLFSIDYTSKDFKDHSLSIFRRENSSFGYELNASKEKDSSTSFKATLALYF